MKKATSSIEDFENIVEGFLDKILKQNSKKKDLKNATLVGLFGDLGVGKTTFVQSLAKYLGIKQKITSPTFPIMKRYPIRLPERPTSGNIYGDIYHIDAYRLEGKDIPKELEMLGWGDIISNPKNLVMVEWPEILGKYLPKNIVKIKIEHLKNNGRGINIIFPKS